MYIELAATYSTLGEALARSGLHAESVAALRPALAQRAQFEEAQPSNQRIRLRRAQAVLAWGLGLADAGKPDEGTATIRRALDQLADPTLAGRETAVELATARAALAAMLSADHPDEAR